MQSQNILLFLLRLILLKIINITITVTTTTTRALAWHNRRANNLIAIPRAVHRHIYSHNVDVYACTWNYSDYSKQEKKTWILIIRTSKQTDVLHVYFACLRKRTFINITATYVQTAFTGCAETNSTDIHVHIQSTFTIREHTLTPSSDVHVVSTDAVTTQHN